MPRKITMTRAEFDKFWSEVFGDDWYTEDDDIPDSFWDSKDPATTVTFEAPYLCWQGSGHPEPTDWYTQRDLNRPDGLSFAALVDRWRKRQKVAVVAVEVPVEKVADIHRLIAEIGGHVLTNDQKETHAHP